MPPFGSRDDSNLVDELLQQGLTFFAANRVEQAVARWRQVLELAPGEPRALDYLASAGHPFAEGTGQSGTPVGPHTQAPDSGEIEVFEIAPISHRSAWPRATSMAPARAAPSRASVMAPWLLIAVLLPLVGYLVFAQLGGGAKLPDREAAGSVERAQPAPAAPAASQPAPPVAPSVAPAPEAPAVAPAAEPAAAPASAADDTYVVTLSVVPSSATIKIDGQQVARGEYIARLKRDGAAHTVEISAPRYQTRELTFVDQPPPERVRLQLDRATRKARRAQREAEREKQRARDRDKDGEKGGEKEADKGGEKEAERAQTEPKSPPPAAAPARRSDNINPWAAPR